MSLAPRILRSTAPRPDVLLSLQQDRSFLFLQTPYVSQKVRSVMERTYLEDAWDTGSPTYRRNTAGCLTADSGGRMDANQVGVSLTTVREKMASRIRCDCPGCVEHLVQLSSGTNWATRGCFFMRAKMMSPHFYFVGQLLSIVNLFMLLASSVPP